MHRLMTALGVTLALVVAAGAAAASAQAGKGSRLSACTVMSRDLVEKYDTGNPQVLKTITPTEEPIGTHGSMCDDGNIGFQMNPFVRSDDLRKSPGKDWQAVPGVGDTAFFRNKADTYAELMVWTGPHHFTIQMGVPVGGTVDGVRPKAIGLATAIVAKLR